jgi:hypothetical protein
MMSSNIFSSRLVNKQSNDFRMPIITTNISGNKIEVLEKDLISHRQIKQAS